MTDKEIKKHQIVLILNMEHHLRKNKHISAVFQ